MKRLSLLLCSLLLIGTWTVTPAASADSSHARIVRLSLVQGDVRFSREFHKDAMEDPKAVWEVAPLNLPIREGYALATDANSRAEVEFENGAMAFLSANTLVEFYDLSLDEGAHITRLILRQGSAIFYVHPAKGDYFSVTGGDFSVEANGRSRFRLDNFDDGSNVNVELGEINVLRNKSSKTLEKGQSYALNINDGTAPVIARTPDSDDFDKWVSGRIDSVATATVYTSQYVNSPDYTSGFADLYNYGSFYNVPGYGYGWQPYGVGLGWSPFSFGSWYSDPFFGWNFIGSAPWGWLPYHYGGWILSPSFGWVWMPTGFGYGMGYGGGYGMGYSGGYGGYYGPIYRPVTGVWVHSGSTVGLVPSNPGDRPGRTPLNLSHGIYALQGNALAANVVPATGDKWSVTKNPPRSSLTATTFATTTHPTRTSRTILSGNYGARPVTLSRDSSIVYDPGQHRFVNGKASRTATEEAKVPSATTGANASHETVAAGGPNHNQTQGTVARGAAIPVRPHINPPSPPLTGNGNASHGQAVGIWGNSSAAAPGTTVSPSHSTSAPSHSTSAPSTGGHSGGGHH